LESSHGVLGEKEKEGKSRSLGYHWLVKRSGQPIAKISFIFFLLLLGSLHYLLEIPKVEIDECLGLKRTAFGFQALIINFGSQGIMVMKI
jgi:hypothetical protein